MSVLIKGMKMPENCEKCPIREGTFCDIINKDIDRFYSGSIKRDPDCPLVDLGKHGRLIDADAAMKQWGLDKATKYGNETAEQQHFSYSTMMMYEIVDILDDAHTVIEAEGK